MSAADLIKNRAAAVKAAAPKNPAPKAAASNPKENIVSKPQTTEKPRSEDPSKNSEEERKRNNQMLSQEEAHEKLAQEMQQRNENLKREGELKKEEALQTDKPVQSGSDRLAPRVHVKPGSREKTPNETKKRHSTGKNGGVREPITLAELGVIAAKEQGIAPPKTYQLTPFETKAIGIKTPEMQGPNKNQ
ncbi:MAG: hypothetical protein LBT34_02705 [Clostridiales Family XIII bacterium]|nr:hypothetical protein [Clostridiales Family XIII bacterium]